MRVLAMARPRRPSSEAEAVRAAALNVKGTVSARAAIIARRVVAEIIADAQADDALDRAMLELRRRLELDPIVALAIDPETDLALALRVERIRAFEARDCRQISIEAWQSETAVISAKIARKLTRRYREILAKNLP